MLSEEQDEIRIFLEQYVKLMNMWLGGKFIRNNSSDNLQYANKIKEQLDLVKQLDSAHAKCVGALAKNGKVVENVVHQVEENPEFLENN